MGGMATVATIGLRSKMEGCRLFGIMDNMMPRVIAMISSQPILYCTRFHQCEGGCPVQIPFSPPVLLMSTRLFLNLHIRFNVMRS